MRIDKSKKSLSLIAVYAIAAVIYILAFAIVPFPKNSGAAWISFVFSVLAFFASFVMTQRAFFNDAPIVSKVYGYPIFRIGIIYLAAQVVFSLIILTVGFFVKVPYWISLLLSVFMLGLAAVGFIATDNAKDIVEKIDDETNVETKTVEVFNANIADIIDSCKNADIKKELDFLAEKFRFSDPVSSENTKEIENQIQMLLAKLNTVINQNYDESKTIIKQLTNALNKRNRICKMNK